MDKRADPVHRSVAFSRTQVDDAQGRLEKVASERWERECANTLGDDFPGTLLTDPALRPGSLAWRAPVERPLTQEEATAMASLFQWLFTPMGRAMMEEVYNKAGWKMQLTPPGQAPGIPQASSFEDAAALERHAVANNL